MNFERSRFVLLLFLLEKLYKISYNCYHLHEIKVSCIGKMTLILYQSK